MRGWRRCVALRRGNENRRVKTRVKATLDSIVATLEETHEPQAPRATRGGTRTHTGRSSGPSRSRLPGSGRHACTVAGCGETFTRAIGLRKHTTKVRQVWGGVGWWGGTRVCRLCSHPNMCSPAPRGRDCANPVLLSHVCAKTRIPCRRCPLPLVNNRDMPV